MGSASSPVSSDELGSLLILKDFFFCYAYQKFRFLSVGGLIRLIFSGVRELAIHIGSLQFQLSSATVDGRAFVVGINSKSSGRFFQTFPIDLAWELYESECWLIADDSSLVICEEITWRPFFILVVGSWSSIHRTEFLLVVSTRASIRKSTIYMFPEFNVQFQVANRKQYKLLLHAFMLSMETVENISHQVLWWFPRMKKKDFE